MNSCKPKLAEHNYELNASTDLDSVPPRAGRKTSYDFFAIKEIRDKIVEVVYNWDAEERVHPTHSHTAVTGASRVLGSLRLVSKIFNESARYFKFRVCRFDLSIARADCHGFARLIPEKWVDNNLTRYARSLQIAGAWTWDDAGRDPAQRLTGNWRNVDSDVLTALGRQRFANILAEFKKLRKVDFQVDSPTVLAAMTAFNANGHGIKDLGINKGFDEISALQSIHGGL